MESILYNIHYLKALHVIFMTTWFAGLFFIGRMFVYDKEAENKETQEKEILQTFLRKAQKKVLYIIIWPSLIFTFTLGLWLMHLLKAYKEGWFHFKFLFVLGLIAYTFFAARYRKKILKIKSKQSSFKLRLLNELPGLFLIIIVFTVYAKDWFSGLWALAILFLLIFLLVLIYKQFFKKITKRQDETPLTS